MYSSETWTLATKLGKKVDRAEMRILADMVGYTLKDHIRNTVIRYEQTKYTGSRHSSVGIVTGYGLNSQGSFLVERMESKRVPKQLVDYTRRGTRLDARIYAGRINQRIGTYRKVRVLRLMMNRLSPTPCMLQYT